MATALNNNTFDNAVIKSDIPVLVDFWATWCGPCRMMTPIVDELSESASGKFAVYKVDVDECEELAKKYGIRMVPTFVVFKNGVEISRVSGVVKKQELVNMLG